MLKEPNWDVAEARLVQEGRKAVERFATEHASELCSFFAFSVDYCFGDVILCFDTHDNGLLRAKRHEVQTLRARETRLGGERGWENAPYILERDRLVSHNPHTANFKYPDFARVHFSDWEGYFGNDQLPDRPDPLGHVIVLMHKVIGQLVSSGSFDRLAKSVPFRIGAEFPRDDLGLVVMRLLNWPPHQGPRV